MMTFDLEAIPFEPGFYVAATPIGNLADVSLRLLAALERAELILAEDTRRTKKLLAHYTIKSKGLQSFHENSKLTEKRLSDIEKIIEAGGVVVLVSDAGTPLIADPGFPLVRALQEMAVPIFSLPGPSAVMAALSVAALPCHQFSFGGFLPNKSVARKKYLGTFQEDRGSVIFYESPFRLLASLKDMLEVFGSDRLVLVAREMTKKFEEVKLLPIEAMIEFFEQKKIKGEITLVVAPSKK